MWEAIRLTTMDSGLVFMVISGSAARGQIFDADDITDLHLSDIDHYLIDQGCRVCHVGNLVQILLQNAFCDLFMVLQRTISATE